MGIIGTAARQEKTSRNWWGGASQIRKGLNLKMNVEKIQEHNWPAALHKSTKYVPADARGTVMDYRNVLILLLKT